MVRLSSACIFDGSGDPPFAGWVGVSHGRIDRVSRGPVGGGALGDPLVELQEFTILPGLIDAHSHLGLVGFPPDPGASVAVVAAQIFDNLRLALDEGFTTVRDLGGLDGGVVDAVRRGLVEGPRILPSGPIISQTGGHGDWRGAFSHDRRSGNLPGLLQPSVLADGLAAVRLAGRSALRDGAAQLKVAISGGFSSDFDKLGDVQFSRDELEALVAVARASHTYVTAHAHHAEAVRLGLDAGVECFEHGTFLDSDTVRAMHAGGAGLVATLSIVEHYQDPNERRTLRPDLVPHAEAAFPSMCKSVRMAVDAGVTVGCGSDLTGPNQRRRGREIAVRAGVTGPLEAVAAATSSNARILRMDGEIGALRERMAADLVVVDGDPRDDPGLFEDGRRVRLVVRAGRLCKNTLPEPLAQAVTSAFTPAQ
ncbi:MAG TPA: amidohydrolase family protein [Candidatus Dormibacteraeota bacterium]|nr:amidohydrolase family protein [Candidatus Dormibacteraeota bacterium]